VKRPRLHPAARLALRVLLFLLVLNLAAEGAARLLFASPAVMRSGFVGAEVHLAVAKAARPPPPGTRVVLLGDSVANQLYFVGEDHGPVHSLAANQAIELPGMLALLQSSFRALPEGATHPPVALAVVPWTFDHNLDQVFTYHYFIKVFNREPHRSGFSPAVREWVDAWPRARWAALPLVRLSAWSPRGKPPDGRGWNLAFDSLSRMAALCRERGVPFRVVCPPIRADHLALVKASTATWPDHPELGSLLRDYLSTVITLPDDRFQDGAHYRDPASLGPNPLGL
jgi:hypothetical protein